MSRPYIKDTNNDTIKPTKSLHLIKGNMSQIKTEIRKKRCKNNKEPWAFTVMRSGWFILQPQISDGPQSSPQWIHNHFT